METKEWIRPSKWKPLKCVNANDKNARNDEKSSRHAVLNHNTECEKDADKIDLEHSEWNPINTTQRNAERRDHEKIIKNDAEKDTDKENEDSNDKFSESH